MLSLSPSSVWRIYKLGGGGGDNFKDDSSKLSQIFRVDVVYLESNDGGSLGFHSSL